MVCAGLKVFKTLLPRDLAAASPDFHTYSGLQAKRVMTEKLELAGFTPVPVLTTTQTTEGMMKREHKLTQPYKAALSIPQIKQERTWKVAAGEKIRPILV